MISAFEEDFKASRVLEWGKGYCVQKAVLLAALARAAGIPSRLAFAKIRNHRTPEHIVKKVGTNVFPRHGYNQFYCDGRWVSAVAAFDRDLCKATACRRWSSMVRRMQSFRNMIAGRPYIEYIEKYPSTADLPFQWIVPVIAERLVLTNGRGWPNKGATDQVVIKAEAKGSFSVVSLNFRGGSPGSSDRDSFPAFPVHSGSPCQRHP